MRKVVLVIALVLAITVILAGCGEQSPQPALENSQEPETPTTASSQPSTPQPTSQSSFETVGMFDNSPVMVAVSYYVQNPTKTEITEECEALKTRFIDSGITKNLRVSFFDDRANTPDYSGGYDIPEASQPYEVANYFFNANNSETDLRFLKTIP